MHNQRGSQGRGEAYSRQGHHGDEFVFLPFWCVSLCSPPTGVLNLCHNAIYAVILIFIITAIYINKPKSTVVNALQSASMLQNAFLKIFFVSLSKVIKHGRKCSLGPQKPQYISLSFKFSSLYKKAEYKNWIWLRSNL